MWPSSSVKVTFIFIIRWTLYCCVLVPSTKSVGSIEFEIWTIVWRKLKWRHNDVISHLNFMKFIHTPRVYQSDIPNFIFIQIGSSVRMVFVHKKCRTHRQTHTHTDTQTNCSENITPPSTIQSIHYPSNWLEKRQLFKLTTVSLHHGNHGGFDNYILISK